MAGGKILTTGAGATLGFGSTALQANSRLLATAKSNIYNWSIIASSASPVSRITGAFTLSENGTGGGLVLTGNGLASLPRTDMATLELLGSIKVIQGNNAYVSTELSGEVNIYAPASNNVTFSANGTSGGVITLTSAVIISGGTLTTRGTGALRFNNAAVTTLTGPQDQDLPRLMTGAGGILQGNLSLKEGSVLTIGSLFTVGGNTNPFYDEPSALNIGSGTVKLNSGGSIVLGHNGASSIGTFTITPAIKIGGITGGGNGGITGYPDADDATITLSAKDIIGAFGAGTTYSSSVSATVTINDTGNTITITPVSGGNTITSESKLYSSN
jgi:hypothetical protein